MMGKSQLGARQTREIDEDTYPLLAMLIYCI